MPITNGVFRSVRVRARRLKVLVWILVFTLLLTSGGLIGSGARFDEGAGQFGWIDVVAAQSPSCDGLVREAEDGILLWSVRHRK